MQRRVIGLVSAAVFCIALVGFFSVDPVVVAKAPPPTVPLVETLAVYALAGWVIVSFGVKVVMMLNLRVKAVHYIALWLAGAVLALVLVSLGINPTGTYKWAPVHQVSGVVIAFMVWIDYLDMRRRAT